MRKEDIIAVLRSEGELSFIQAHTALAALLNARLIKPTLRFGSYFMVTNPDAVPSWGDYVRRYIKDEETRSRLLAFEETADSSRLDFKDFRRLLGFYIDAQSAISSQKLVFSKDQVGKSCAVLSALPASWVTKASQSFDVNVVHSLVSLSGRSRELVLPENNLTLGYPVEIKDGRLIPVFYVRISSAKQGISSVDLDTFELDLIPKINEEWLKVQFSSRRQGAQAVKNQFISECDLYAEELSDTDFFDRLSQYRNRSSWSRLARAVSSRCETAQPLITDSLRTYDDKLPDGIYNIALLGRCVENDYIKSTLHDLEFLRQCNFEAYEHQRNEGREHASVLPYFFFTPLPDQAFYEELVCTDARELPFNAEQRESAASMLQNKITVLQGPPGTGKTQVIAAAAINAAAQGKSVLITSFNHQAISALMERLEKVDLAQGLAVRANSDQKSDEVSLYKSLKALEPASVGEFRADEPARKAAALNEALLLLQQEYETVDKVRSLLAEERTAERVKSVLFSGNDAASKACRELYAYLLGHCSRAAELENLQKLMQEYNRLCLCDDLFSAFFRWRLSGRLRSQLGRCFKENGRAAVDSFLKNNAGRTLYLDLLKLCTDSIKRREELAKYPQYLDLDAVLAKLSDRLQQIYENEFTASLKALSRAALYRDKNEEDKFQCIEPLRQYSYSTVDEQDLINEGLIKSREKAEEMRRAVELALSHRKIWLCSSRSVHRFFPLLEGMFDLVIFDESSQFDFIGSLPVFFRAKAAAVVGDPEQLGPVIKGMSVEKQNMLLAKQHLQVKSRDARLLLHNREPYFGQIYNSLYLFASRVPRVTQIMLRESFRSHKTITGFISDLSYNGQLVSARTSNPPLPSVLGCSYGFKWVDVPDEVQRAEGSSSRYSMVEAQKVVELLQELYLDDSFEGSIGVIAPYNRQATEISRLVKADPYLSAQLEQEHEIEFDEDGSPVSIADTTAERLFISTVHKAQGSERDVIILSLCATCHMSNSFIEQKNIMNVALSRARSLVIVVGNAKAAVHSSAGAASKGSGNFLARLALEGGVEIEQYSLQRHEDFRRSEDKLESVPERELYMAMLDEGLNPIVQHEVMGRKEGHQIYKRRLDFALIDESRRCYLDIEVDGSCHKDSFGRRKSDDYLRDEQLKSLNFQVIRFWAKEINADPQGCAQKVKYMWQQMLTKAADAENKEQEHV